MKNLILVGGTGYLGNLLQNHFKKKYPIIILSRRKKTHNDGIIQLSWKDNWQKYINNETIIINLTGKSINCLFTKKNKTELINSRIEATNRINKAIINATNPPKLFIQASGISFYAETFESKFDEYHFKKGTDFLSILTQKWENSFYAIHTPKTRKIAIRLAPVLGKNSNAIKSLIPIVKLGLGGKQGNGKQLFPFIHENDFILAIEHLIKNKTLSNSVNIIAPTLTTNKSFMQCFREQFHLKFGLPTPAIILQISKFITKVEPEIILTSLFAKPTKLVETNFTFKHPNISSTLEEIISQKIK